MKTQHYISLWIVVLFTQLRAVSTVYYVDLNSPNPTPPYTNWQLAAHNIQDAVELAFFPGDEIIVTNGIYSTGGRAIGGTMTNRVAVDRPVGLRSVNGPEVTVIQGHQVQGTTNGDGAVRCAYLVDGASLTGFTLTGGATRTEWPDSRGGGLFCTSTRALVTNCVIESNASLSGGGASDRSEEHTSELQSLRH